MLCIPSGATRRWYLAIGAALALAGCATPSQRMPPGTPATQVMADMGRPSVTCPLPDGGERLVWSGQPFSQASWATNAAPDGSTTGVEQVLTDASFARLRQGQWSADQVRCTFGPPAQIANVGLPRSSQRVWSYAYLQDTVWNSLMHVYFDNAGYVTHFHPGPDPAYDADSIFGR